MGGPWFLHSASEQAELWRRWKAGETIAAISRAMGRSDPDLAGGGAGARRDCSAGTLPLSAGIDTGRARGDLARAWCSPIDSPDCRASWAIAIDGQPRDCA